MLKRLSSLPVPFFCGPAPVPGPVFLQRRLNDHAVQIISIRYDKLLYKQRNQVERLFRRLKRFRRIFTRYDKLDVVFLAFVHFALHR